MDERVKSAAAVVAAGVANEEGTKARMDELLELARQGDRMDALGRLRLPFPVEAIDKLPKPFKRDALKGKCLPRSEGGNAPEDQDYYCGKWHGLPAFHLNYVGHAYVTERLLDVDPLWTWEPMAFDERGLPRFVANEMGDPVAFWIKLTACEKTVIGVGTVEPGCKEPEKQLISDAIRNAAMRLGIALDMWMKSGEDDVVQDVRTAGAGVPGGAPTRLTVRQDVLDTSTRPPAQPVANKIFAASNPKHVFDVPITIRETFEQFSAETLGGRGRYKDATWASMIGDDPDRLDYLENYLVEKAAEAWKTTSDADKATGKTVIPVYQKVLLTYQEHLDRKGAVAAVDLT